MHRRDVLRGLLASGAAVTVSACGGAGASSGATSTTTGAAPPAPVPAPPATPTPSPVATLRGVTIDQAQAEIAAPIETAGGFFTAARTIQSEVTVTTVDQLQAAIVQAFDTTANPQALSTHQRILCAWNGSSTLSTGPAAPVIVGRKLLTTGHRDAGGSLTIAAASGYTPDIANSITVYARGVKFQGLGFVRRGLAGENPDVINAVTLARNSTYPVASFVEFERCAFGSRTYAPLNSNAPWINGLATNGHLADYVSLKDCTFIGHENGCKIVAKSVRIDGCDYQSVLQDCIALYGHSYETDYYAHAWVSRTTFRRSPDDWASRSAHSDSIQTGTSADRHLGYRLLVTDSFSHLGRRFSGEAGLGGGTQGIYNDDHLTADNQFVVRRSAFLVTAPHGFCYYSPRASRPSFIDKSVFTRAGHVPSAFAPDPLSQDFAVGITGAEPAGGPWLLVTDTIAKKSTTIATVEMTSVDPRVTTLIGVGERPESIFVGRDFGRGNAAVNGLANKLGYALPNEAGTQARFIADIWANFQTQGAHAGKGLPNPSALAWAG